MNSKIYINGSEIVQEIGRLKEVKNKIENNFINLCKETNNIPDFWTGEAGTLALQRLNKYEKGFAKLINELDIKISFLESVLKSYQDFDATLQKIIIEKLGDGDLYGEE